MLEDLRTLVEVESPSRRPRGPDRLGRGGRRRSSSAASAGRPCLVESEAGPHVHWSGGGDPAGAGPRPPRHRVPARHPGAPPVRRRGRAGRPAPGSSTCSAAWCRPCTALATLEDRSGVEILVTSDEEVGSPRLAGAHRGARPRVRRGPRPRGRRRRRRPQDRPQGLRHVRGRHHGPGLARGPRARGRGQRPDRGGAPGAGHRGARPAGGRHDRHADRRVRGHPGQRRARGGDRRRRRPGRVGRREGAHRDRVRGARAAPAGARRSRSTGRIGRPADAGVGVGRSSSRWPRATAAGDRGHGRSAAAATATSRRRWGCRPSTASGRSGAARTPTTSTCWWTPSLDRVHLTAGLLRRAHEPMTDDDWIAHHRPGDRERLGWIRPEGDGFVASTPWAAPSRARSTGWPPRRRSRSAGCTGSPTCGSSTARRHPRARAHRRGDARARRREGRRLRRRGRGDRAATCCRSRRRTRCARSRATPGRSTGLAGAHPRRRHRQRACARRSDRRARSGRASTTTSGTAPVTGCSARRRDATT